MPGETNTAKALDPVPHLPGASTSKPSAPRAVTTKPDAVSLSDVTYDNSNARTSASAFFVRPGFVPEHTQLCCFITYSNVSKISVKGHLAVAHHDSALTSPPPPKFSSSMLVLTCYCTPFNVSRTCPCVSRSYTRLLHQPVNSPWQPSFCTRALTYVAPHPPIPPNPNPFTPPPLSPPSSFPDPATHPCLSGFHNACNCSNHYGCLTSRSDW